MKRELSSTAVTRPPLGHAPIIFDGSFTATRKKALFQGAKARVVCVASALGCWGGDCKGSAAGGRAKAGFGGGRRIEAKGGQRKGEFVGKAVKRFLFSKVESRARAETVGCTFKNSEPSCKRPECVCVCV